MECDSGRHAQASSDEAYAKLVELEALETLLEELDESADGRVQSDLSPESRAKLSALSLSGAADLRRYIAAAHSLLDENDQ